MKHNNFFTPFLFEIEQGQTVHRSEVIDKYRTKQTNKNERNSKCCIKKYEKLITIKNVLVIEL